MNIKLLITKAHKSKTLALAYALAALGFLQANQQLFSDILEPKHYGWFTFAVGMAIALLRVVTTKPLDAK